MNKLSDKEVAFIQRAQREAANSETDIANGPDTTIGWDDAAVLGAESAFPETVIGWDNPAAGNTESQTATGDKWAYIAAMIETERAAAYASRARSRRIVLSVVGVVVAAAFIALLQIFVA
ncbi:MAG TPA: hypothetical protein VIQ28_04330 [Burkholderiales bacterium]